MKAIEVKTLTPEQQSIVTYSREYLHEISENPEISPSYNWFGCENDAELLAEIEQIAKGENLCTVNESELVRTLDIMYHG
jgi:hypothetical protein|tara:strand:+ start:1113 stop:1352 length:240 start_codon:yes stop_codon:yes gene_type:complete